MIGNTFGERMRACRLTKQIKGVEMSSFLRVAPAAVRSYETGLTEPSLDTLISIAKKLDVSTDYLLGLTDERRW